MAETYNDNVAAVSGKRFMPKVANATFKVDGAVAFRATANTDSDVNIQTTQDQITGGQNNAVIGVVTSEKTIEVSFSTPEWQPEFLAANVGETIQIGSFTFEIGGESYTAVDGVITLPSIPVDNVIYVEINGDYITVAATSTEVDLSSYGITDDCVTVIAKYNKDGKRINLSVDTDPFVGELTLDSPIYEGTKGKVGLSQYVFPAFALSGNWEHTYGSDASYEISGIAVATSSSTCGEGQSYGYYQEYIDDEDLSYTSLSVSPSVVELTVSDTETLVAYGSKNALYDKTVLDSDVTYASADASVATVGESTGVVTAVAEGETTITVTYGSLSATVTVTVSAAE